MIRPTKGEIRLAPASAQAAAYTSNAMLALLLHNTWLAAYM